AEPLVPQPALGPANPGNIQDADLSQGVSTVDGSGRVATPELDRSARPLDAMPGRTVEAGQSSNHIAGPAAGALRQTAEPLVPQPALGPANPGNIQDADLPQGVSTVDNVGREASVGRVATPELDRSARLLDAMSGRTAEASQSGNHIAGPVAGVLRQMAEPLTPQPALRLANPGNIQDADLPQGASTVDSIGREASVGRVVTPEVDRSARAFDAMPGRTAEAVQSGNHVTQANQFRETLVNAEAQTRGAPPAQESLTAARNAPAEPAPAPVTTAPAQSNPVTAATPAAPGASQTQQSALAALFNVPLTPSKPGWEQDMGTRISYLLKNNQSVAELKLSPASLGTIEVRISGDSERTEVSFFSQNPATRELIEANLPRLRETFANSGIALADVDVSGESLRDHREEQAAAGARSGVPGHESDENSDPDQATSRGVTLVGDHVVDTFI
ncbi:MAG: flagellar hook-length control protein FliK, partial [Gammaproteobacteria bacterium]